VSVQFDQTDDSVLLPSITEHLRTSLKTYFGDEAWGEESIGEGLEHAWTGIMGPSGFLLTLQKIREKKGLTGER
jgi:hypothetical protein